MSNRTAVKLCLRCLIALFAVSAVVGCGSGDSDDADASAMQEVNFSILHEGSYISGGNSEKEYATLSNQSSYELRLSQFSDDPPQAIDFTAQRVLMVAMGSQINGGFSIGVARVEEDADGLVATIELRSSGSGCITTQALTDPFQFVLVPGTDDEVRVVETSVVVDCS